MAEYPNPVALLSKFNADEMVRFCRGALDRCFVGTAPTLGEVCEAYGEKPCVVWLSGLIYDLNDFVGQRQQTPQQCDSLAWMLLDEAKQYKLTEVMYFFYRYKIGLNGEFYGGVNSHKVLSDLKKFKQVQGEELDRIYKAEAARRDEEIRRQRKNIAMKRETYMWTLGWRAMYGDKEAIERLEAAYNTEGFRKTLGVP